MKMIHSRYFDFHEGLHVLKDPATGLTGLIAVHSTARGPAAGGTRCWSYTNTEELVVDAMRLSRGMSYKNAIAGLPFGGGKAVIQRPPGSSFDREALFRAFGDAVASLRGQYITAEDVGTTVADMHTVRSRTRFVAGLHTEGEAAGGDPSPWTALGVFECLKAASLEMLGLSLRGATVAVQGLGNVGSRLCHLLAKEGAKLIVADVDTARAQALAQKFGAKQLDSQEIVSVEADIFAPCALGAVINDVSLPNLKFKLICGGANNQLANEHHGELLRQRGIVYAPDYIVNAGGIINVCAEYLGENAGGVEGRVRAIPSRLVSVLREAETSGRAANLVADDLARRIIAGAD
ncbi:Glu/Leu/Phe/Val dehydrogenase [Bradyrhizobium sp. BEA-2-5]|uniref:Leu/Phe/Val dehydrogenase n=1 Tax=Bradyrhizobium sp. BEA-2-5 TaxID=3080015 RepID=UPI00293F3385|nr:Glu/Leu/Phe/Val dehydrogenase [Bradyrhizobium sp. BEA-2-5]WOH80344.1 Glu/Leu/Phe/Val dehydrogenase [Bradyrhizobium sp. BEA-2-5]